MESYEEFCRRALAELQERGAPERTTCEPLTPQSVICFHGRPVLSPLLNAEQCRVMREHRGKAVQLEVKRQSQQRSNHQVQAQKAPSEEVEKLPVSISTTVSGYTLVTDPPGLPRVPGLERQTNDQAASPSQSSISGSKAVKEAKVESEEKSEEEEEDDISLDSLLKVSRDYVKKELSQQGSEAVCTVTKTPLPETVADKERQTSSPKRDVAWDFGFSLRHSPIGPPRTPAQHQTLYEPSLQQSCCLPACLPDQYAPLPSPEFRMRPSPQRRRPRPVSAGNIHFSFPIGPADLIPRNPGGLGECDSLSGAAESSDHWSTGGSDVSIRGGSRQLSHSGTNPLQEFGGPRSASGCSPMGQHDHLAAGFRRRCHTFDSQLHHYHSGAESFDRSQERVPRFMAGVTWTAPSRCSPAASMNQTYEVDSRSPPMLRPRRTSDGAQDTVRTEPDTHRTSNGRIPSAVFRNTTEAQAIETEESKRRAPGLEDMQRLKEEHALQMSLLLAEQEEEQRHFHLELEEMERILREQGCVQPLGAEAHGWACSSVGDGSPVAGPSCQGRSAAPSPSEPSPTHSFPRPVRSSVSSPSTQPPVYFSRPRARLSWVLTAAQQRGLCHIGAIIRGFLTRRLLGTEKVKHLRKTVVDTQEFIRSFRTEATEKTGNISAQDRSLEERVRAQLKGALKDIHNIFFEMSLVDRLELLEQERKLQAERKLRDMEKTTCSKERLVLSAATQRSLVRKNKVSESPAQARKMQQKPKSPTANRSHTHQSIKPNQGQNSPQLNRQGSWYRRAPQERVRRCDSLKKQHSLG